MNPPLPHGRLSGTAPADETVESRQMNMMPRLVARGSLVALGSFLVLGTLAALWPNPLFMRMTPTGGFEVALLAAQSVLLGVYLAIPMPACATRLAGIGSVANFLGIACPICNKVLLFLFGAQALLAHLEPVRIYLAAAGALITGVAVIVRWRRFHASKGDASSFPMRSPGRAR